MAATAVHTPAPALAGATSAVAVVPAPPQSPTGAMAAFTNSSLYVGDLDPSVDEGQLYDLFNQVAQVVSVRVCRDQSRRVSLGYAYVNFGTPQDALSAREVLNFTPVNGKPIRIMFSHRDPSIRKTGFANVYIKNLESSIDNKALYETFAAFGTVLSCKVAVDGNGKSKGHGFVQFDAEEAANNAIKRLNGMLINDKQVYVGRFIRRQERSGGNVPEKFTNVYVKNLSETTSDEDLDKLFNKFGPVTSAVVMKDENGKSKCFGFVNFQNTDDAAVAVEELNGSTMNEKVLYVSRAQKKSEREAELKAKFELERASRFEKLKHSNLYLKNLDDSITDEKLKEIFSEYGTISSCKVMLDPQGTSKGAGFVAFSNPDEATRALSEMNGKLIGRKPLYVALAQRKDERRAWLQAHFAQMRPTGAMPPLPAGIPGFHPGAPRIAPQQLYFGQGSPGLMPPQAAAGYGFQQPLVPGLRPGVAPNFIMPYQLHRQGQAAQRVGARRGANTQPTQQWMQRNSNQGGLGRYTANGNHPTSLASQSLMGPIMPLPFDVSGGVAASAIDIQRPAPIATPTLASTLASASPEDQRMMLGEQLYPLVERLERDQAGKVTGMLLEMDQTEVLHLIEAPEALKKKVAEAMDVLRSASDSNGGDKFGSAI
nr:polyadenylate-binding protein 3 [Ipomoea batatas]